ncbi:hypothetical protein PIB30_085930 [Stylosanthes scabra]|uniref:Zinc knuckle CX2CX4HX4C domain-containing protein n=1 Tax=Stylosanthes scabra TaxID=79078 RepID=A0ABU6ZRP7_9FABA|nr:hypothetical protein [Stylosanthes scabra]
MDNRVLQVGCKLARRIGKVREVDLFEVKGRENRIVKARVELNGMGKIRDSLKLSGLNLDQFEVGLRYERIGVVCLYCAGLGHVSRNYQTLLEDSQKNRVRQEALGEWIKADQVGRRIYSPDFRRSNESDNGKESFPQPEKKPPPNWLAEGFSKLNLKGNLSGDSKMKKNQAAHNEEDESLNSEGGREVLSELVVPMNMEENIIVGNSYAPIRRNIQKIKQAARQKGGDGGRERGGKRASSGKENVGNGKRICLESTDLKEAEVEGASRQLAPKEL